MRGISVRDAVNNFALAAVVVVSAVAIGAAQEKAHTNDPRVGLKPGIKDAGMAIKGLELVASQSKPDGMFDPKNPMGDPLPAEGANITPPAPPPPGTPPPPPRAPGGLDFANSDLAFSGTHMFLGNFNGFQVYDIERSNKPRAIASIACPGGQGDVSVWGNLLIMSVEQTRGRIDCGMQGVAAPSSPERFRGIRIFDIKDISKPKQVGIVQTCRGSHTHTIVGTSADKQFLYVYGSGTGQVRPGDELSGCSAGDPKDNPNTSLFSIDVIEIPLADPSKAKIVNQPRIFLDIATGNIAGLWAGGDHGPNTQRTSTTNQCHDITVYPSLGLAAGACSGNGILLDVKDPKNPKRLDYASDPNFAYWHSAAFNNDGTKIVFTDEWGGGTRPRCRASDLLTWGADAIFDIVDGKKLKFAGYYKMPAAQTEQENCVAHNGSLVPIPGRDIKVQAWYQGGLSMFDFTDSAHPIEIAYFDRGPLDAKNLLLGGYWSTYWYNGFIYGSEIARGMDVFKMIPSEYVTKNEIDAALQVRMEELNVQSQPHFTWPATVVVGRAYLDQLNRSKSLSPARAAAVKDALDKADKTKVNAATLDSITAVATELDGDAAKATGIDQKRMKALAETIRGRVAALK